MQLVHTIQDPVFTDGKIVKASRDDPDAISYVQILLGLLHLENADIFVSGSNFRFLGSDIVTDSRDRSDEIHMFPLSFSEFASAKNGMDMQEALEEYMLYGGMPHILSCLSAEQKETYLKNLFELTYKKDVLEYNKIKKSQELDKFIRVLARLTGSYVNARKIRDTFKSQYKSELSVNTIHAWLKMLEEAYLIEKAERLEVRGRKRIGGVCKYYFSDPGLRNALLNFLHRDRGHVMENLIYSELVIRGFSVDIGVQETFTKNQDGKTLRTMLETDFIAEKGSRIYYIQAAWDLNSAQQEERERRPLLKAGKSWKKIIVHGQRQPVRHDEEGILYIGILDFLLKADSLDL